MKTIYRLSYSIKSGMPLFIEGLDSVPCTVIGISHD